MNLALETISTGYYGNTQKRTKVHLIKEGKPYCGTSYDTSLTYQWCSHTISLYVLECERCKKKHLKEKYKNQRVVTRQVTYTEFIIVDGSTDEEAEANALKHDGRWAQSNDTVHEIVSIEPAIK